jgi:hypothetical protein
VSTKSSQEQLPADGPAVSRDRRDPDLDLAPGDFEAQFGESLRDVLDLESWSAGGDLEALYERLDDEVARAIVREDRVREAIRAKVLERIADPSREQAPPLAGVWQLSAEDVSRVHRGALFCGDVEACDGTAQLHDSIGLTIVRLGVAVVSYRGGEGTWSHRLYRRDLRGSCGDPYDEVVELLDRRERRSGVATRDRLTELGTRGLTTYAERAILTDRATARWRLGHGSPAPFEILTGAGAMDLVQAGLAVLRRLILGHRRFLFVPSPPGNGALPAVGMALRPLEFAVVCKLRGEIDAVVERGHLRGERLRDARDFVGEAGEQVAVGVFRVSESSPPHVFYAPAEPELCGQAAAIAMADAALQEHRGFPLLVDVAQAVCRTSCGREDFTAAIQASYSAHGRPMPHLGERETGN